MRDKILSNTALFLTALIWGLSFVAQRAGMEYIDPFTFNTIRSILGGFSLIPLILWMKYSAPDTRTAEIKRTQHMNLARAGIGCGVALFIAMTIQQYCMQYVGAGKAGFITALYVVFVPVITILYGEKLNKNIVISVILSVVGLYLLCFKPDSAINKYDLFILLSAFFYAVHILVVSYYSKQVNPVKASCLQFFVVGILSFILMSLFETVNWCAVYACRVPLLYAGVITCGAAYTLQIYGQKDVSPIVASLIFCLEAVFAVLGGIAILGESLGIKEFFGCIFVIFAVVLANLKIERRF